MYQKNPINNIEIDNNTENSKSYIYYDNLTNRKNNPNFSNDNINDRYLDTESSYENSNNKQNGGLTLIQAKREVQKPIDYTSQSFFLNKKSNNLIERNSKTQNDNYLPMKMKGDFSSLISNNTNLSKLKNPRIQVTNTTCDLEQILESLPKNKNSVLHDPDKFVFSDMDNSDGENINDINNRKIVLKSIVENCDNDLYGDQNPYKPQRNKWVSMSVPLNEQNDEAKWTLLNNTITGEKNKNNTRKFELIQRQMPTKGNDNSIFYDTRTNKTNASKRRKYNRHTNRSVAAKPDNTYKGEQYSLREMNYAQFYKSPEIGERNENSLISNDKKSIITNKDLRNARVKTNNNNNNNVKNKNHHRYRSIDCDSNTSSLYETELKKNNNFGYGNNYGKVGMKTNKPKNTGRNKNYH